MKKLLIIFLTCLTHFSAMADWTGYVNVTEFYVNSSMNDGTIFVYVESPINPDNCTNGDFYALPKNTSMKDEMMSLLLAASMSGKKVNFWLSGCSSASSRPLIKNVKMKI